MVRESFNRTQLRAINYGLSAGDKNAPPLLVLAGPGTGKTRVIVGRANRLVTRGVPADRILILAFGNRASGELDSRLGLNKTNHKRNAQGSSCVGTFHSMGARYIGRFARHVGLNPHFTILSRQDSIDVLAFCIGRMPKAVRQELPDRDTCLRIYSLWANSLGPLPDVLTNRFPGSRKAEASLVDLFARYDAEKLKANSADFDDLLRLWLALLNDSRIGPKIRGQFDHVLIDEYQDTSPLQGQILRSLKPDGEGLFVVGDDAQCIYTFRGASVENILQFPQQFSPEAKIIKLKRNYRSTVPIVIAFNAVMGRTLQGLPKELISNRQKRRPRLVAVENHHAEAKYVADVIQGRQNRGIPLQDQAVLFRERGQVQRLIKELKRRKIPFQHPSDLGFFEKKVVRDALAVIRWGVNYRDRNAAIRVLRLLPQVNATRAKAIFEAVTDTGSFGRKTGVLPKRALRPWDGLRKILRAIQEDAVTAGKAIDGIRRWFRSFARTGKKQRFQDTKNLKKLQALPTGKISCLRFINDQALDSENHLNKRDFLERVTLCTVHAAKGREWDFVTLLGATDGNMPLSFCKSSLDYEEERRVFGVAISRARNALQIMYPRRRKLAGTTEMDQRLTPFLSRSCLRHFKLTGARARVKSDPRRF